MEDWGFCLNKEKGRGGRERSVFCGRRRKKTEEKKRRRERTENKNGEFKFNFDKFTALLIVLFI